MQNIVNFKDDEAADVPTLVTMLEQCLKRKLYLNSPIIVHS